MTKDPYRYFRVEAREIVDGLSHGILQLEKNTAKPDTIARLLRLGHTLKGAARVVKQAEIAELAHRLEGILAGHQNTNEPLPQEQTSEMLLLIDEIAARVKALEPALETRDAATPAAAPESQPESVRVDIQEMEALLRSVAETTSRFASMRKGAKTLGHLRTVATSLLHQLSTRPLGGDSTVVSATQRARALAQELQSGLDGVRRTLAMDVERVAAELGEIHDIAHQLRLLRTQAMFPALDRAVRDAAHELGKRVTFEMTGGEIRLDANALTMLREALAHVVRNAVTHGIEGAEERIRAGKPPVGRVLLHVSRRGNRVAFVCRDDGRGVDVEAVRRAAVTRGVVPSSNASSLTADQVIELLGTAGLSTSPDITELSGRGIGLDIVRTISNRLGGTMTILAEVGRGVSVEVVVPISVASFQGLVAEFATARVVIPLDSIRQIRRLGEVELIQTPDRETLLHEGEVIPFVALESIVLGRVQRTGGRRLWSAVIIEAGDRRAALGVDRLLGTSTVVMRPVPAWVEPDPIVAGALLDVDGSPQIVLDPTGLVRAAERGRGVVPDRRAAERAPILVVDDSLTTRMLEQSILESAGYEVELAVSAEEALSKARDRRYALFVVDVEMPGMDGFEFVAQVRADTTLRDVPSILVTSRSSTEDRRRGEQVGARAYIVKSEFDQDHLLQVIRGLTA